MSELPLNMAAIILGAVFVLSLFLTGLVRRYALRALLDIPNDRSSHDRPTPRGGGVAIVAVLLRVFSLLGWVVLMPSGVVWALLGGGGLVAGIGWVDDHRHVPALWRALLHGVAACWAVFWLGGFPSLELGLMTLPLGIVGSFLAVLALVWLTNLYNFMDGIDGIAGGQAVSAGLGGAVLLGWAGAYELALVAALLAAGSAGFLVWNWAPAKIFMGDVGSGFVGFCFGVLALASEKAGAVPATVWMIVLAVFLLDATFTLLRRVFTGERWYTAHRTHAYQRLVQMGWTHVRVSATVMLINIGILLPLAYVSLKWPALLPWSLALIVALGWVMWKKTMMEHQRQVAVRLSEDQG